ncbi:unnamed protein product [Hymenolepis diminuta]|uniref:Structure-specific endonuclease subunit SLX1 homolog n=1 Tax=Hymenolepis diminuta TaxID=6216 RepID=A0A0R3SVK0_HYMDI|nr:unnamed protein product [Hymenolepis diminuta]
MTAKIESACGLNGFHGCYLLVSLNSKCSGRTYIGYTVNPKRRIQQHNSGIKSGGARSTCGKGPWVMVLIVHGFPNDVSALRFEWAWQNPYQSRRVPYVPPKTKRETPFQFRFRILCQMLRVRPWSRLCLTLRWINQEYYQEFPPGLSPPLHIPVAYGPIESTEIADEKVVNVGQFCQLCNAPFQVSVSLHLFSPFDHDTFMSKMKADSSGILAVLSCPGNCEDGFWHALCLARHLTKDDGELIPLNGKCPSCNHAELLWPNLLENRREVH